MTPTPEPAADRAIAIHGHFYQPPRENPWLEAIERQESAHPFHDWNARITAECYAPNAAARILGDDGRIVRIVDNYERISFNVGPTLLKWLEEEAPDTYAAILEADRRSIDRYGHGSAIAQVYNHMILPLANARDRRTQVHWGVRDFERRFGRKPEGMWLPETAVDLDTLEALAEAGIRFTILEPGQAARFRRDGDEEWTETSEQGIDVGRGWRQTLPSGKTIDLFFYDGPVSRGVAFERLLENGERFARRLTGLFEKHPLPRLVHIATDGETYGHHHTHGEMALAYALRTIEEDPAIRLVNYVRWLEDHPVVDEVEIAENTSWSCAHGIERWRADCGCSTGGREGWNQAWRGPLREALDALRDRLAPVWEAAAREIFDDPWGARDAYVDVVLDRSDENVARWLDEHAREPLDEAGVVRALQLMEIQRHAMLMYTSCGWFFAELSGIETVQVIQYAGRALQLAESLFGEDFEGPFLERLEAARSNLPEWGNGRDVYERAVRPAMVDLRKVGAHYAVSSLFEEYDDEARIYCYEISRRDERRTETGRARLVTGRARIRSTITRKEREVAYAALHLGDHNVVGGVRDVEEDAAWEALVGELVQVFERADFPDAIRLLDERFQAERYSLRSLFRDEQRRVIKAILEGSISRAAGQLVQIYENRAPLMRFLAGLAIPAPRPFRMAAEFTINTRLRRTLRQERPDLEEARRLVEAARLEHVDLEGPEVAFAARKAIETLAGRLAETPEGLAGLEELDDAVAFATELPLHVVLWGVQNVYWRLLGDPYPAMKARAGAGDADAAAWVERFEALGGRLAVDVERATAARDEENGFPAVGPASGRPTAASAASVPAD